MAVRERESFRQEFDRICDILQQYHLRFTGDADEMRSQRGKAFDICLPILEEISLKWNLNRDLSPSIRKLLSMLSIDHESKETFAQVFDLIVLKIGEQEKHIAMLQSRLDHFEEKCSLDSWKIEAHELVYLFKFYFVDKLIRKHYASHKLHNWNQLTGK
jgi:hypothetical protein